jgi:hypothetical protein
LQCVGCSKFFAVGSPARFWNTHKCSVLQTAQGKAIQAQARTAAIVFMYKLGVLTQFAHAPDDAESWRGDTFSLPGDHSTTYCAAKHDMTATWRLFIRSQETRHKQKTNNYNTAFKDCHNCVERCNRPRSTTDTDRST